MAGDEMPRQAETRKIFTIGHSTRALGDFINLLSTHHIQVLADVRRFPRSRRLPHFNDESLAAQLPENGFEYVAFGSLGGRRKALPDSVNAGFRNDSFRGYADYMQTAAF